MNILLVYGGRSCEHDISIITACLAKGYFNGNIYSAYLSQNNECYYVPSNITPKQHKGANFKWQVVFLLGKKQVALTCKNKIKKVLDIDVVVNCCHGQCGEDGALAGLCELANLPIVGSDVVSSGIAMDKIATKQALCSLGFPTVESVWLQRSFSPTDIENIEKLGYPIIVKPSRLGSSIGITLCHNLTQTKEALETALWYDDRVLCEKALTNFYELNCAAMRTKNGLETSSVERPFTSHDILTFQDKYLRGEKFPQQKSDVPAKLSSKVKNMTQEIYDKIGLGGVVRIDYLVDAETEEVFVNEINSIPGSLSYGLWRHKYTPQQFGALLVEQAIANFEANLKLNHKFSSQVLDNNSVAKK